MAFTIGVYLYPRSVFTASACIKIGVSAHFFLIKGNCSFRDWKYNPSQVSNVYEEEFSTCLSNYSYVVPNGQENDYYLIFYSDEQGDASLTISLSFDRYEYSTDNLHLAASCDAKSNSQCSLDIPYDSKYQALIVTDIPNGVDLEENVDIRFECKDRVWVYVLSILIPILSVVPCITLPCLYCAFTKALCNNKKA